MALSSSTAAHVVDAMATEMAPRIVNPYPNKVIHADIRIQSIDDESQRDGPFSQSNDILVESKPTAEDADKEKAAEMHANWWAEAIAKNMDLPNGYSKAAVLLIKWADHLDELGTGEEVCRRGENVQVPHQLTNS